MTTVRQQSGYSGKLREMFEMINPYHFPCLYKTTFEHHAMEVLRIFEDQVVPGIRFDSIPGAQKILPRSPIQRNTHNLASPASASEWSQNSSPDRKRKHPSFSVTNFYDAIALDAQRFKYTEQEISAWAVCKDATLVHENLGLLQLAREVQPGCPTLNQKSRRSFSQEGSATNQNQSNDSGPKAAFGRTNAAVAPKNLRHCYSDRMVGVRSKQLHVKENGVAIREDPRPEADPCKLTRESSFQHSLNRSTHLERYREQYTRKNIQHALLQLAQRFCTTQDKLGRAAVKYMHRMPAYSEAKPAIKLSQFKFQIDKKNKHKNTFITVVQGVSPTVSQRDSPLASPTGKNHRPKSDTTERNIKNPVGKSGGTLPRPPPSPYVPVQGNSYSKRGPDGKLVLIRPQPKFSRKERCQLIVCRSRPSIPSNANGQTCATALETPSHQVTGFKGTKWTGAGMDRHAQVMKSKDALQKKAEGDAHHPHFQRPTPKTKNNLVCKYH